MSAHRDPVLRAQLALDISGQIASLAALYGEASPPQVPTTAATPNHSPRFTPLDGTLATSPAGGLSWKPAPWPRSAVNRAGDDVIRVCIDHSSLTRRSRRAPLEIAKLRAEIAEWRAVRGIYTCRGYGSPDAWRMPTLAGILRDVLSTVSLVHPTVRPHVSSAIVRASTYRRRHGGPSHNRIVAEAELDGRDGLLQCALYFSDDASQGVRDWLLCFPSVFMFNSSDDVTLARVVRLSRATNGSPDTQVSEQYRFTADSEPISDHDGEHDDGDEDDDREDLFSRVLLHTVRQYLAPRATWEDISPYVNGLRCAIAQKHGERP